MLRCLIVDDSPRFVAAARAMLERDGISVVGVASTPADALQLAEELRPDVTLLDVHLGFESGFELARTLHRDVRRAAGQLILISTHAQDDYADMIAASPVLGYLAKSSLSGGAIRDLLSRGGGGLEAPISEPPGT